MGGGPEDACARSPPSPIFQGKINMKRYLVINQLIQDFVKGTGARGVANYIISDNHVHFRLHDMPHSQKYLYCGTVLR
jgi:hypothetical protein